MNDILEISADGTTLTKVLDNSITHLTIPNGVSKFNRGVFKECINLESFDIPDALIDIDIVSLLGGCKSLLSINVGEGNRRYKAIDGILYSKDLTKIIFVPRGKKMECFTIPDCVSEIGERAFSRCNSIVSIVIPNTVISIGRDAFANCESLQTINIPDYITEIDAFLDGRTSIHFRGCSSLHSIFIPENVTEIDEYAFSRCTSLQEIIVHKRNRNYTSIDGILYSKDLSKIIIVPIGKEVKQFTVPKEVKQISGFQHCISLEEIIISQNVERIESYTFSGCISLQKVTISGNVSEIKMCTFEDCKSLHDITLSDGIKCIGQAAFRNCISLQNIYIPNSVKKISRNAFDGCTSLNTIKVGDENPVFSSTQGILYSKDLKKILRVPQNAKLENFTIPEGVTEIGDCAFDGCDSLHYIDIPNTVIKIGEFAFYGCDGLSSITIPKGMLSIGCSAFEYCLSLSIIKIPDSVEDIGDNAFEGCEKLKEVHIPMTISKIGDDAFKGTEWYKGIESENTDFVTINNILIKYKGDKNCVDLSIPFGIKVIGHNLFKGCTELKNVDIPNSVTTIGKSAFYGCKSIETIDIPNSVVEIGESAFAMCTSLQDIDIPKSVTRIGPRAFSGCSSLKEIDLPANLKIIEWETFSECTSLEKISIPESVNFIGYKAFHNSGIEMLSIPKSVEWIGEHALCNCPLKSIEVSEENPVYSSIEGVLYCYHELYYNKDGSLWYYLGNKEKGIKSLIKYPPQKEREIFVLDEKVVALSSCAFKKANQLKEIVLHNNVRCLGEQQTFAKCSSIKKINIPPIHKIPRLAFSNCSSLEEVDLPHTENLLIERDAFENCSALNTIRAYTEKTDSISIENAFEKTLFDKCILYIPSGSRWAYKHHPVLGRFKNILIEK